MADIDGLRFPSDTEALFESVAPSPSVAVAVHTTVVPGIEPVE